MLAKNEIESQNSLVINLEIEQFNIDNELRLIRDNLNSKYSKEFCLTNSIDSESYRKGFEEYLDDIFYGYSNQNDILTSLEDSSNRVISKESLLYFLNPYSITLSQKILKALKSNKGGYTESQFKEFFLKLKFGGYKKVMKILFKILDFNGDDIVNTEDIRFFINKLPPFLSDFGYSFNDVNKALNKELKLEFSDFHNLIINIDKKSNFFFLIYESIYKTFLMPNNILFFYKDIIQNNSIKDIESINEPLINDLTFDESLNVSISRGHEKSNSINVVNRQNRLSSFKRCSIKPKAVTLNDTLKTKEIKNTLMKESIEKSLLKNSNNLLSLFSAAEYNASTNVSSTFIDFPENSSDIFKNKKLIDKKNINNVGQYDTDNLDITDIFKSKVKMEEDVLVLEDIDIKDINLKQATLIKQHIKLINNILYFYRIEQAQLENYTQNIYLNNSFVKENPTVAIEGNIFYSLTLFYYKTRSMTILHQNQQFVKDFIKGVRKSTEYDNFFDHFSIHEKIGEGSFGKVYKGVNLKTKEKVAVKIIDKSDKNYNWMTVKSELDILKQVNHRNVVKFLGEYENSNFFFIVCEYISGISLRQFFKLNQTVLKEQLLATIVFKIAEAIQHIHNLGIMHRDIKHDNILIFSNDESADKIKASNVEIKLIDFGLSKVLSKYELANERTGSLVFASPEVLKHKPAYEKSIDIWSFGICLYYLSSGGYVPFDTTQGIEKVVEEICTLDRKIELRKKLKNYYSPNLLNLINGCVNRDIKQRYTIDQVLDHKWFSEILH